MEEILYAYWLSNLDGIGNKTIRALLEYAGSLEDIWNMTQADLNDPALGLKVPVRKLILSSRDEGAVTGSYENMLKKGIRFYHYAHPEYPRRLKNIYGPPQGIYVLGRLPDPEAVSVGIVGSRNCSEYGRMMAGKLASVLASAGIGIISGMARGIDGTAQEAALKAGGYSCGVLGCGVDICYPEENKGLYDKLSASGGLLSEYHPGIMPQSGQFPLRNRIISALSDIVVVVEARERSGSLITADQALEQGKDVYALPGRVCDPLSQGCNRLIRQGAGIILSAQDFLAEIAADRIPGSGRPDRASDEEDEKIPENMGDQEGIQMTLTGSLMLSEDEKRIMSVMDYSPKSVTALLDATGFDTGKLYSCLMHLSMKGCIIQQGGRYVLNGETG